MTNEPGTAAPLYGLVLAGGRSRRMGQDKAALPADGGGTWLDRAVFLLTGVCENVWVAARSEQMSNPVYARHSVIADAYSDIGPAAGLLSAWDEHPRVALLVLATDLLRMSNQGLSQLIGAREPNRYATAFLHEDGTPEPLCTIWEPSARSELRRRMELAQTSLREFLASKPCQLIKPREPRWILGANTPAERPDPG